MIKWEVCYDYLVYSGNDCCKIVIYFFIGSDVGFIVIYVRYIGFIIDVFK